MMQKRDIEKLRMKTVMSESLSLVKNSPYQSIRDNAALKLKFLQEEFKAIFGEYSEEHVLENELENKWEIIEAKRSDGVVFKIGDSCQDNNKITFVIKTMWIGDNGNLMAQEKDGGFIGLFNVKKTN